MRRVKHKPLKPPKRHYLCLDHDDPELELDFEVRWQLVLSPREHFRRMWKRSLEIAQMMVTHGHQKPAGVFQRS